MAEDSALTRFANSEIHQNVAETNVTINLRFVVGKRVGVASSGRTDDEGLRAAGRAAPPRSPGSSRSSTTGAACPGPTEIRRRRRPRYSRGDRRREPGVPGRGASGPSSRAADDGRRDRLRLVRDRAPRSIAVANSNGRPRRRDADDRRSSSRSRWARTAAPATPRRPRSTPRRSTRRRIGREAAEKARATANAVAVEPGDYPVVLEEYAVVDLLDMLGYLGFSALAVQEERSFVEPGKRIGSDLVTIVDDGYDPAGPADVRSTTRASPSSGSPLVEAGRLPRGRLRRPDRGPRRRRARPATACPPRTRGARSR